MPEDDQQMLGIFRGPATHIRQVQTDKESSGFLGDIPSFKSVFENSPTAKDCSPCNSKCHGTPIQEEKTMSSVAATNFQIECKHNCH